jgi:hypothetical protein
MKLALTSAAVLLLSLSIQAQQQETKETAPPIQINGTFPSFSVIAGHKDRTEAGIGALA